MSDVRFARQITPPGPHGIPLFGSTMGFRRDPLGFLARCAEEYGDVFQFPLFKYALTPMEPKSRCYVINHPQGIKQVCVTHKNKYRPHQQLVDRLRNVLQLDDGELLTSTGSQWHDRKAVLQPSFSQHGIAQLHNSADQAVRRSLLSWSRLPNGTPVAVNEFMLRLVTEVVAMTFSGLDLNEIDPDLSDAWVRTLDGFSGQLAAPCLFVEKLRVRLNRRSRNAPVLVERHIERLMQLRQTQPGRCCDLLAFWIDSVRGEHRAPLSGKALRDQLLLLLVAGRRNVANALGWSIYLLGNHPEVAVRLRQEADTVADGEPLTLTQLNGLHYIRMVQQEALRLFPPAWLIARRCIADDEVGGYAIPRGATVFMSPYLLHRHPAYWESPDSFLPERFARPELLDRDAYLPFGKGPRACIGKVFTDYLLQLVLLHVAKRFVLAPIADRRVRLKAAASLHPHGLIMTLQHRQKERAL